MNRPAHTVPSQLRHYAKTLAANLALNFTAYVTSTEADSGNIHCFPEAVPQQPATRFPSILLNPVS